MSVRSLSRRCRSAASRNNYRVSSAKLGRENEEDLSFHPDGIKDFGVHDLNDPREGKRTPIDIVMEYVLDVPIEEIAARSNTVEFKKAPGSRRRGGRNLVGLHCQKASFFKRTTVRTSSVLGLFSALSAHFAYG